MATFPNIKADIENALTYFSQKTNTNEPLIVLTTGYEKCSKTKRILGPDIYGYSILHFVHSGVGYVRYKIKDKVETITIKENNVFLIESGYEYSYWPDSNNPWEYSQCH